MNLQHTMLTLLRNRGGDPFEALRRSLFSANEQGLWPRPDQFNAPLTQYKESTGQNIVTAVGDTVGLAIDWRLGRTFGDEKILNGTEWIGASGNTPPNNWTCVGTLVQFTIVGGALLIERNSDGAHPLEQSFATTTGSHYVIEFDILTNSNGLRLTRAGSALLEYNPGDVGSKRFIFSATGSSTVIGFLVIGSITGSVTIDNVTIKELPGNHAYQATASKRPLLACVPARGRVNELLNTEFAGAVSGSPGTLPTGYTGGVVSGTVTTVYTGGVIDATVGTTSRITYRPANYTAANGQTLTLAVDVFVHSGTLIASQAILIGSGVAGTITYYFDGVLTTSGTAIPTGQWVRVSGRIVFSASGSTINQFGIGASSTVSNIRAEFRRPQLESGVETNYQRVGAGIYDVTEVGQPTLYGWLSDGVDDNLETNAFDPATDKVTVCAGVRKLSDAATGVVLEHGAVASTNGSCAIFAPNGASNNITMFSRGTATTSATAGSLSAPISRVVTGVGDISAPLSRIRINGADITTNTGSQGTGNYTSQKTYILARLGAVSFYNGYTFALCLRFAATDTALLSRLEDFVAVKTLGAKL